MEDLMKLADRVDQIKSQEKSADQNEQIKRYQEEMARMESNGYISLEPEGYRIPLDQRAAMTCLYER